MVRHPHRYRLAVVLFTLGLLAAAGLAQGARAQTAERCFAETGQCISGPIRAFWERNGGLAVFGLPIGPQQEESIEGRPVQVQWFERNRLELHPENAPPYNVLIGRVGADLLALQGRDWFTFPKSGPRDGCRFFPETGHNVCGEILNAWSRSGIELDGRAGTTGAESLALFGLPLSDEMRETIQGQEYSVQWFERGRLEFHPENAPPYNVLLGRLGAEIRGGGGPPPSPSDPCAGVPVSLNGLVQPGNCVNLGDTITVAIAGFESEEALGYWLTGPDGRIIQTDVVISSGGDRRFEFNTRDLYPGVWFWVFQGTSSGHSAIVYFKVIGNPAAPPPPPPAPATSYIVTWATSQGLTDPGAKATFPWVVVDSNSRTHMVYSTDDGSLWYTNDIAGSFAPPQLISNRVGANREPYFAIAIGPGNILHLAYSQYGADQQIYYQQGRLDGATAFWTGPQLISSGAKSVAAHVAVDGNNNAYISWIDNRCGEYNVFFRVRRPDGSLSDINAPAADCVFQNRPQVAVTTNGVVHLVFQHGREIYYGRLEGGGWSLFDISQSPSVNSLNPTIATDGERIFVAWDENINGHDVQYRTSGDNGRNWSEPRAVSNTSAFASFPNATFSTTSRRVLLVWSDATDAAPVQPEVWYTEFDLSTGALSDSQRLTYLSGQSTLPVVAAGPSRISVTWQDKTSGNWQAFHLDGALVGR